MATSILPGNRSAKFAAALLVLTVAVPSEAEAVFRWPWETPRHARRHYHRQQVEPPPNCDKINEAVRALEPKNLIRALRDSTTKQRQTIADCAKAIDP
jgi:hypothetical protein